MGYRATYRFVAEWREERAAAAAEAAAATAAVTAAHALRVVKVEGPVWM